MSTERGTATRKIVVGWINQILVQKRWTGTDLARNAGLAPSTILRLLNDPQHEFIPTLKTLHKIADASGVAIPRKVTDALGVARFESQDQESGEPTTQGQSPRRGFAPSIARPPKTVPLISVSSIPVGLRPKDASGAAAVPSLPQLDDDETVSAFYMPDSSLEPWIKAKTLIYTSRLRDPIMNDIVLITNKDGRSTVRLLDEIDERGLTLRSTQSDRPPEIIPFDKIESISYVVATVAA